MTIQVLSKEVINGYDQRLTPEVDPDSEIGTLPPFLYLECMFSHHSHIRSYFKDVALRE